MNHVILINDTGARVRVDLQRGTLRIRRSELGILRPATKTDAMRLAHWCEDYIRADDLANLVNRRR